MLNKLWVEEGKASKLILVQVHHEQLVGGGEVCALAGELPVKVGNVLPVFLEEQNDIYGTKSTTNTRQKMIVNFLFIQYFLISDNILIHLI